MTVLIATDVVDCDELTWGAEPNIRAVVKQRIADIIAMKLRTNDLIDWQWRTVDGKLEVTGSVAVRPIDDLINALKEAERFLDYWVSDARTFVGPGTPSSALETVRAAIRSRSQTQEG